MALSVWFYVMIFLLVFVGVGIFVFILIKTRKKPEDEPLTFKERRGMNPMIVLNCLPHLSDGHAFLAYGGSDFQKSGIDTVEIVHAFPLDIQVLEDGKGVEKTEKEYKIFVHKGRTRIIPLGDWSSWRAVMVIEPQHFADIPEGLRNTIIGQAIDLDLRIQAIIQPFIKMSKEEGVTKDKIMEEFAGGEMTRKKLAEFTAMYKTIASQQLAANLNEGKNKLLTDQSNPKEK